MGHLCVLLLFQNHDYVIISGARRKEQRWDPKANEQIVPEGTTDITYVLSRIQVAVQ